MIVGIDLGEAKNSVAAKAEAGHNRGRPVGLSVNTGPGIAASLVINGQVLPDAFGLADEFGDAAVGDLSAVASLARSCGSIGFRKAALAVPEVHSPRLADGLDEPQVWQGLGGGLTWRSASATDAFVIGALAFARPAVQSLDETRT